MIADAKAQFRKAQELNPNVPEVLEILREIEGKHGGQAALMTHRRL